ncbi:hypothetical protein M2284_000923 [Rhodococcus sp. LBL1]|nr:hypothetical protein [Rhodococcus sp. LBL1]MDH6682982.1 hypothetical protein [Rhodococcus sp. LBL2]
MLTTTPIRGRVDQGGLAKMVELAELPEVVKSLVLGASDLPALA